MTIQEMHIGLDLGLQEVNSQIENDFGPEEKDWFINQEIRKFISSRISPKSNPKGEGFDEIKKRLDDLQNLKTAKLLSVYISNSLDFKPSVFTFLPSNYLHEIETTPNVFNNCNGNTITQNSSIVNYYSYSFPVNYTFTNFKIEIFVNNQWVTIFDASTVPNLNNGILSDYSFFIKDVVTDSINKNHNDKIEVSWEEFGDLYFSNKLIFVDRLNIVSSIRITDTTTNTHNLLQLTYSIHNLTGKTLKPSECRYYPSDIITDRLKDPFTKTKHNSVVSELFGNKIKLYEDNFNISQINFKYIRKPQRVNSTFNINCDLKEDFHHEIVSNTVAFIKSLINTNTYQQYLNENLKTE